MVPPLEDSGFGVGVLGWAALRCCWGPFPGRRPGGSVHLPWGIMGLHSLFAIVYALRSLLFPSSSTRRRTRGDGRGDASSFAGPLWALPARDAVSFNFQKMPGKCFAIMA